MHVSVTGLMTHSCHRTEERHCIDVVLEPGLALCHSMSSSVSCEYVRLCCHTVAGSEIQMTNAGEQAETMY